MGVARTKTIKNKHAANGSGIKGSKASRAGPMDGIVKAKKKPPPSSKGPTSAKAAALMMKKKKKVYSEKDLDIPTLNMITPIGVEKPKGKKKGKVFVDDRESMNTILAMVQADKNGQIESKMIKARQMEGIREARKAETEKKEQEKKSKMEDAKDGLRKKRARAKSTTDADDDAIVKDARRTSTKATKDKKKRVSFA